MIHENDNAPNVAEDSDSATHDFHTAEVTKQQYEVSQLLEERDLSGCLCQFDKFSR